MTSIKKHLASWSCALAAAVMVCLYPCVFIFARNAGEARAADMLFFLRIFLDAALAGLVVTGLVFRNASRAGFVTCLGLLVVINFGLLADAVPIPGKLLLGLIAAILLGISILLLIRKPDMTAACLLIAIAFGAMCLVNLALAAPTLLRGSSTEAAAAEADGEQLPVLLGEKRNVYFLLFDEYGGSENLEHYYGTDNGDFLGALEELGFSVSRSSRNTESCWTDTLLPNLLNLDYLAADSMTELERRSLLEQPYLYRLFSENGYQINLINHRAYLSTVGTRELTEDQTEDSISEYLLENSIFQKIEPLRFRIAKQLWRNYRDRYQEPMENCLSLLESCADYTAGSPTLTVSYIQCPHSPFLYQADGTLVETIARWNWKDSSYYTDQLTYLNTLLLRSVENIRTSDPDAVILLLSDHGARVPIHKVEQYGGPRFDAETETPFMQNALCCVLVPGGSPEIEGETGINAIRKTLNAAFGTELPLLTPPEGYVVDESANAPE